MFEPIESRKFLGKKANTRSDEGGERNRRRQRKGTWNLELDVVEERKKKKEERGFIRFSLSSFSGLWGKQVFVFLIIK